MQTGESTMGVVPDFALPAADELVTKYNECSYYNVVYCVPNEGAKSTRNGLVACDLDFHEKNVSATEGTRVYGKIRYFLALRHKQWGPAHRVIIVYIDWFTQTQGDGLNVSCKHPNKDIVACRAVPIEAIVCKIALVPVSKGGMVCSVVELL